MTKCPICGNAISDSEVSGTREFLFNCSNCGRFDILQSFSEDHLQDDETKYDKEKLKSYLFFNAKKDVLYYFIGNKINYNEAKTKNKGFLPNSIYLSPEEVENWYPKTFFDKINKILLYLNSKSKFEGDAVYVSTTETVQLFFSDEINFITQSIFYIDYLIEQNLLDKQLLKKSLAGYSGKFLLTPKAYSIIYDLQKNQVMNTNVFVAMSFNEKTNSTRECIRQAIINSGHSPAFIDEIIHNHQIVPEMLRLIKESRFLILEITDPNYGSYYEAGYALGLEKEIIVCCREDIFNKEYKTEEEKKYQKYLKPHFDIVQKQILVWKDETDLIKKLTEWIKYIFKD